MGPLREPEQSSASSGFWLGKLRDPQGAAKISTAYQSAGHYQGTTRMNEASDHLLTVKQVAERDRCSEKTIRRAITAGLLRALRIGPSGRLLRIRRADHEAYRRSQL